MNIPVSCSDLFLCHGKSIGSYIALKQHVSFTQALFSHTNKNIRSTSGFSILPKDILACTLE